MQISEPACQVAAAIAKYLEEAYSFQAAREGHLSGGGAIAGLESKLANHFGMRHALCVSNATAGLFGLALAMGLKHSEFVTSPYTYGGSISSWMLLGNRAIFADVDPDTLTLNAAAARKAIGHNTRAMLVPDALGNPADMAALRKVADAAGIWYIADAAASLGASRGGRPSGSLADAVVVSFTAGKTLFAGEGGAIVTDNGELYEKLLWYTQHPARQHRELGFYSEIGFNARIHPLAAIWADSTFAESLKDLARYQNRCFQIIEALNGTGLTIPIKYKQRGIAPSFFRFTAAWKRKPEPGPLVELLRSKNISVDLVPVPITLLYRQPGFIAEYRRRFRVISCEQAEQAVRNRFCMNQV